MGIGRKLYIEDDGLEIYSNKVKHYTDSNNDANDRFVDIIECKDYILRQLKLASKLPKVQSISVSATGVIRIRTNDLFITTTETGRLRKFFVGRWKIEIDYYSDLKFYSLDVAKLGFTSTTWSGTNLCVHPHISGRTHEACLGNAATPISLYVSTGNIKALVMYLLGYLESVNVADSAGCQVGNVHEVALDEDGNVFHNEDGEYQYIDNEFTHIQYHNKSVARTFDKQIDTKHKEYLTSEARKCNACHKPYNMPHLKTIMNNGNRVYLCEECAETYKTCDCCGNLTSNKDKVEIDGVILCKHCAGEYLPQCTYCHEYIVPDDFDKENLKESLMKIKYNIEFNKKHHLFMADRRGDTEVELKVLCDKCLDIARTTDQIKNNIIDFEKMNVENSSCKVLFNNIPVLTINNRCTNCGDATPIEQAVILSNGDMWCSRCASGKCNDNSYKEGFIDKVKDKYIRIIGIKTKDGYRIKRFKAKDGVFVENHTGILLPISLLTDDKKDILLQNPTTTKYFDIKNNELAIVEKETKCSRCGKVLKEDDNTYRDRAGNIFCKDCAESTYTRCAECQKIIPLTNLAFNDLNIATNSNVCTDCYVNDNQIF